MGRTAPCKNCPDRVFGCHDVCKAYKDWAEEKHREGKEKHDWKNTKSRLTLESAKTKRSAQVLRNRGRRY